MIAENQQNNVLHGNNKAEKSGFEFVGRQSHCGNFDGLRFFAFLWSCMNGRHVNSRHKLGKANSSGHKKHIARKSTALEAYRLAISKGGGLDLLWGPCQFGGNVLVMCRGIGEYFPHNFASLVTNTCFYGEKNARH